MIVLGAVGATVVCSLTTVVDASIEAAMDSAPPPCVPQSVIDTPLTSTLESWSLRSFSQSGGYPKVAVGGIWQTTTLALRSFDLELEFHVKCTESGSCADGLGVG